MERKNKAGFISILEFWELFSTYVPASSRIIGLPPISGMIDGLNYYFGELTNHSVLSDQNNELKIMCSNCINLQKVRNEAVCETHLGVIKGTIQRLTGKEAEVSFNPNNDLVNCRITVSEKI